ncbi:uncharacterized protein LOC144715601 isoform X2 [Wolffia australiana]
MEEKSAKPMKNNSDSPAKDRPSSAYKAGEFARSSFPDYLWQVHDYFMLNEDNYSLWNKIVERKLKGMGIFSHLSRPVLKLGDPQYDGWISDDTSLKLWLLNTMHPDTRKRWFSQAPAKELWDNLHQVYFKSRRLFKLYEIKVKIRSTKQRNQKVMDYYHKLQSLWNELDFYRGTLNGWPDDEGAIKRIIEEDRILDFLIGLKPEYDDLKFQLLQNEEFPSLMK